MGTPTWAGAEERRELRVLRSYEGKATKQTFRHIIFRVLNFVELCAACKPRREIILIPMRFLSFEAVLVAL